MIHRGLSYQGCLIVTRIARAGGVVSNAELHELAGAYSTNAIAALIDRSIICPTVDELWQLTEDGNAIARDLIGQSLPHRTDRPSPENAHE
ncbi:MAG: hypothetical protein ABJF01_17600 [bacterium]